MSLQVRLQDDMKAAMRAREQQRLDTIRMALAALKNARIDRGQDLDDAEMVGVLQKEAKRRRESVAEYRKVNREDLAASEEAELAILEAYLPTMMGADELRPLVAEIIAEVGATNIADLSKVMPVLMKRFKGQAEGGTLNAVARALLSA